MTVSLELVAKGDKGLYISTTADDMYDDVEFCGPRFVPRLCFSVVWGWRAFWIVFLGGQLVEAAKGSHQLRVAINIDSGIV